jgi:membrane associated rhomboid family serine protease
MLGIYVFMGTGMDFIILNCWNNISLWVETLSPVLFHSSYSHLFGNIMVFILSGSALEIWLKKLRFRFFWYFLPILLNLFVSIGIFLLWRYPPIGASFWIIGQSIVLGYYAYLNMDVFNLKSLRDFVFLLITGYCLLESAYNYLVSLIAYHLEETTTILACGHIAFAILCFILISFFHKKIKRASLKMAKYR